MPVLTADVRRAALAAILMALVSLVVTGRAAATSLEYAVKANYLYKFAPFVEWPPRLFATPTVPLTICVAGEDPFGGALEEAVRGQSFNGRPIAVRRLTVVEPEAPCHILFIGRSTSQNLAEALKAVAGEPVLTVTDSDRSGQGGIIQFVIEAGHVRFDIDEAAARANGLAISSKLLSLAVSRRKASQ